MPSILSKLGLSSKQNPYINPHHPGHTPYRKVIRSTTTPGAANNSSSSSSSSSNNQQRRRSQSVPPQLPPIRTASPRGSNDYLAEARSSAGRDPITGRRLDRATTRSRMSLADELRQVEAEERTMYQNRALHSPRLTSGTKYELFAQEMVRQRDEEIRIRAARGGLEYYAPERRLGEYYSGPLVD